MVHLIRIPYLKHTGISSMMTYQVHVDITEKNPRIIFVHVNVITSLSLSNIYIYTIIYNYYIYTHTSKHQSVQHSTVIDEFPYVSELHSMFPNKKHRTY